MDDTKKTTNKILSTATALANDKSAGTKLRGLDTVFVEGAGKNMNRQDAKGAKENGR